MKIKTAIRITKLSLISLVLFLILDFFYLLGLSPDWDRWQDGPVPKSVFIERYEYAAWQDKSLPRLAWQWVPLSNISKNMHKAVVVAEDSRFYQHQGYDADAFKMAMEYNLANRRFIYGASTISQQTVKNLLLSPSRNPLRKWHEFFLTVDMEWSVTKKRILEIYLNIAEFGEGVYGVEAAAQKYWGKSANNLSIYQAAELAATLPAPKNHNPATRSEFFLKKRAKILRNMGIKE